MENFKDVKNRVEERYDQLLKDMKDVAENSPLPPHQSYMSVLVYKMAALEIEMEMVVDVLQMIKAEQMIDSMPNPTGEIH